MTEVSFNVVGIPGPQGSKRHVGNGVMVESSKKVKPWRADVRAAAEQWLAANGNPPLLDGPLSLAVTFFLPRPKSRKRDTWCSTRPDASKLVRSTEDALSGLIWTDDARVARLVVEKVYALADGRPGASIRINTLNNEEKAA